MKLLASFTALALLTAMLNAQSQICWVTQPAAVVTAPSVSADYQWKKWDQDPTRVYLYKGKAQVGAYDLDRHYYQPLDAKGKWGAQTKPPIEPPCFGVDCDKLPAQEKYTHNGREIPKEQAHALIAGTAFADAAPLQALRKPHASYDPK